MSETVIIFSAHESYLPAAIEELHEAVPGARLERVGPDAGRLRTGEVDIAEVAAVCRERPIVFVQHLMRELATIAVGHETEIANEIVSNALDALEDMGTEREIALQVWRSGEAALGPRNDLLWREIAERLSERGYTVARGNREWILSVLITPEQIIAGLNRSEDALVDWPGGRLSLAKPSGQISRSEFKLEELFKVVDIPLPSDGMALDLGASPGGWTRILRRHGLSVWAVDPANLDPRIAADPRVHHVRTTAAQFLANTDQRFDLIVNDMRMTPTRSCGLMLDATRCLNPRAIAILTLKISPHQPLRTVRSCLGLLQRSYEILFARQLYHNRNEVTVIGRLRDT